MGFLPARLRGSRTICSEYETRKAQYAYRCVALPDVCREYTHFPARPRLNAPIGAWCSLTKEPRLLRRQQRSLNAPTGAWRPLTRERWTTHGRHPVSMHLQVRGAPCLSDRDLIILMMYSLNAPTGAWCSPTVYQGRTPRTRSGLNAPTGAWCSLTVKGITVDGEAIESQCTYRCVVLPDDTSPKLLGQSGSLNAPTGAWCSLTGLMISHRAVRGESQCTYRCVVLPDENTWPL